MVTAIGIGHRTADADTGAFIDEVEFDTAYGRTIGCPDHAAENVGALQGDILLRISGSKGKVNGAGGQAGVQAR